MRQSLLLAALLSLASCYSPKVDQVETSTPGSTKQQVVLDEKIGPSLSVVTIRRDELDGFLRAQVEIESTAREKKTFEYVFEWFDENGMQVAATTAIWTQATIFPGERRPFLATAGSKAARDFRFKVKSK